MPLLSSFAAGQKISGNIRPVFRGDVFSTANVSQGNEGTSINFEITTSPQRSAGNVIYWTVEPRRDGTVILNTDFVGGNTGSFALLAGGLQTIAIPLSADAVAEGVETFRLAFRDTSNTGSICGFSPDIVINDTSSNTNVQVFANTSTINETTNNTVEVTVLGFGRTPPNTLFWTTVGPLMTRNSDWVDNVFSGTITLTGTNVIATAALTRVANSDAIVEGSETFTIQFRETDATGPVLATTGTITVQDTSNNNVFIHPNVVTFNETTQSCVRFTINGNNRPDGNVVYWSILNISGGTAATDFLGNVWNGSITLNGTTNFTTNTFDLISRPDFINDGDKTFQLEIRDTSLTGQLVGRSSIITMLDSSNVRMNVYPNVAVNSTINETSNVVITYEVISYGGRVNGNVVYYEFINASTGNIMELADFGAGSEPTANGNITLFGVSSYLSNATIWRQIRDFRFDNVEGQERLALRIRDAGPEGPIITTSGNILINDTANSQFFANANNFALVEPGFDFAPSSSRISITGYGRPSGNVVYWDIYAVAGSLNNDFSTPTSGTITCNGTNNEYGWFGNVVDIVLNTDGIYDPNEVYRVRFRDTSGAGPVFLETPNITAQNQNLVSVAVTVDVFAVGGGGGGKLAGGGGGGTVARTFPNQTFYSSMVIPITVGGGGNGRSGRYSPGRGGNSEINIPAQYLNVPAVLTNFPQPIVAMGGGTSAGWGGWGNDQTDGGSGGGFAQRMPYFGHGSNATIGGQQNSASIPAFSQAPAGAGMPGQAFGPTYPLPLSFAAGGSSGTTAPGATIGQSVLGRPTTIYPTLHSVFGGGGAGATPINRYDPGIPNGGGGNSFINYPVDNKNGKGQTGGGGAAAWHVGPGTNVAQGGGVTPYGPGGFGFPGNIDFTYGGDGAQGVVIFRYPGPQRANGGTIANVAGPATVHIFNGSGTLTWF